MKSCLPFLLACLGAAAPSAWGRDWFLTIGGGPAPDSNQVALERNVVFVRRVVDDAHLPDVRHDVLFSCGDPSGDAAREPALADVNYRKDAPRANDLLARLLLDNPADQGKISLWYRPHALPHVNGPADRPTIQRWFKEHAAQLREGDRLVVYFTGHGGGGRGNGDRNTTLSLWPSQAMTVKEFDALLDGLDPRVRVVLIMAQCHAGGFADVIFEQATAGGRLAAAPRCGFFAAPFDRPASGCTPEIQEEAYQDYSTRFFAALSGRTRTGVAVPAGEADFNHDGKVSLAEAHAYALLHCETTDLPLCTSDVLLRQFSRTRDPKVGGLLSTGSRLGDLARQASAERRAVVEGLAEALGLRLGEPADAAERKREALEAKRTALGRQAPEWAKARDQLRRQIRQRLLKRSPELASPWHPATVALLADEAKAAALVRSIESDPDFARWEDFNGRLRQLDEQREKLSCDAVKCQRLLYAAETIALSANFARLNESNPDLRRRYEALVAEENEVLRE